MISLRVVWLTAYVCFSNRPIWVRRFRLFTTEVNVTRGLVLLSGIDTRALPSWDSRTRGHISGHRNVRMLRRYVVPQVSTLLVKLDAYDRSHTQPA